MEGGAGDKSLFKNEYHDGPFPFCNALRERRMHTEAVKGANSVGTSWLDVSH